MNAILPKLPDLFDFEGYEGIWVMDAAAVYAYRDALLSHLAACWTEVTEEAPGAIIDGKKGLFLDEAALVKLGTALAPAT